MTIQSGAFIIGNQAMGGTGQLAGGGGIYNKAGSELLVNESSIFGNSTDTVGGGIANFGNARVESSSNIGVGIESPPGAEGNRARDGGGIYNAANAVLILRTRLDDGSEFGSSVELASNAASGDGGGILNRGDLTIDSASITRNMAAGSGGGIENRSESGIANSGRLTLLNVTLSGNTASIGGGIDLNSLAAIATIQHTTIANNRSTTGVAGGIHQQGGNTGSVLLFSTLVATNLSTSAASPDLTGTYSAQSRFNLIGVGAGISGLGDPTNRVGTMAQPVNPRLSPLENNGGTTLTHALLPDSIAIQRGGANAQTPTTDQRGEPFLRVFDNLVDIGAYEHQGVGERAEDIFVGGPNPGMGTNVMVLNQFTGSSTTIPNVYPGFQGGVRTANGDLTGDNVPDIITATGAGGGPHIRVFNGETRAQIHSFFAFNSQFNGGIFVAAADVNGDDIADIIVGAGQGGGPHVRVFNGATATLLFEFFAFSPQFTGGVSVAAGDITGDGVPDIIVGAGPGGGPHVRVFDSQARRFLNTPQGSFFAYDPRFNGGVFVSAADFNGDNQIDIMTSPGAGGGPHVRVFNGANGGLLSEFFAYAPTDTSGVRIAGADTTADGRADIVTTNGQQTRIFNAKTLIDRPNAPMQSLVNFFPAPAFFAVSGTAKQRALPPGTSRLVTLAFASVFEESVLSEALPSVSPGETRDKPANQFETGVDLQIVELSWEDSAGSQDSAFDQGAEENLGRPIPALQSRSIPWLEFMGEDSELGFGPFEAPTNPEANGGSGYLPTAFDDLSAELDLLFVAREFLNDLA